MKKITEISELPYQIATKAKEENGQKIIGFFAMHFPEELIHASGAYPLLLQASNEPVTAGHAYYYSFFCGPSRSLVDQAAKETLNFLDAVIVGDYCIQEIGAGEVLGDQLPKVNNLFFRLPVGNMPWTQSDIAIGLKELKADLEKVTGKPITNEAIKQSFKIYNRNRQLLREIYAIREQNPGIISSKDLVKIIQSSMLMPKEENSKLLEELIPALKQHKYINKQGAKVFVSGSLCGAPKFDILSIIENAGATIVGDDLFHGWRYISSDIDETIEDAFEAIAEFYVRRNKDVPCPIRVDPNTNWQQYLVDRIKELGADQLIIIMAKYCEAHMFFYPDIKEAMEKAGIPHLLMEVEHEVVSLEALKTRVEAFLEMTEMAKAL
jgi:benzoyl-CoA reductase subunit C